LNFEIAISSLKPLKKIYHGHRPWSKCIAKAGCAT
jgi:hypothetical protein